MLVCLLFQQPMRLYPPATSNPVALRQWREDVFESWTALVERHLLVFAQDVERKLVPMKEDMHKREIILKNVPSPVRHQII